ncbi:MAG: hypothetical protein QOE83_372 [Actinomycetota bacterium]|jgi:hypothetical protein|nr:hypothetical protein [Actinomycetota bacterium]
MVEVCVASEAGDRFHMIDRTDGSRLHMEGSAEGLVSRELRAGDQPYIASDTTIGSLIRSWSSSSLATSQSPSGGSGGPPRVLTGYLEVA